MKRLLIGVLCALISTCAFAESTFWDSTKSTEGISLSADLGMNVASLTKQNLWGSKVGLNVGIMAEKPVLNSLSVKAGLFYTMKGAKNGGRDTGFGATLRSTLDPGYLEIPVMASYRYQLNEQIRLQFDFGPYFCLRPPRRRRQESLRRRLQPHQDRVQALRQQRADEPL